jgi:multidrug efflux pump
MTSAATVFGHLPLVLATGPGAAARNSIGLVLVTGMTVGTIFTLFVVPVFYSLIAARHETVESSTTPDDVGNEKLTLAGGRELAFPGDAPGVTAGIQGTQPG